MNHFLLPGEHPSGGTHKYGIHLMELLINGLLKAGASRGALEAKVFGGARMSDNLRDIGQSNVIFATQFLSREGIPVLSESTGGRMARRVRFSPTTGHAQQMLINETVDAIVETPKVSPIEPDVTLF
ncbi:chemotaxis protein CheD [Pelagovum pacificum]|nr:chemotaxis protein CheD [Pelagovum pacificum]